MNSFRFLKAARSARQKPLTSQETPPALVVETSTSHGGPSTSQSVSAEPLPTAKEEGLYDLPPSLEVRRTPSRGRGLFATRPMKSGSKTFSTTPKIAVLSTPHLSTHCSGCFLSPHELAVLTGKPPKLLRCTKCKIVRYCSTECQTRDWPGHRPECAAHERLRALYAQSHPGPEDEMRWVQDEAVRALGRVCWARKRERVNGKDPSWWQDVESMESHRTRLLEDEVLGLAKQVQYLRHYLSATTRASSSEGSEPADMAEYGFASSSQLLDLCSAFRVNSFTLASPSLSPIGVAMSPLIALYNHSCQPNAVVVFPEGRREMVVVAISDIQPGEEVLTSYIDVSLPPPERQAGLSKRYGFQCDCELCRNEEEQGWVDPRWCIRHPGCRSRGKGKGKGKMPDLAEDLRAHRGRCDACAEDFVLDLSVLSELLKRGDEILKHDEDGTLDPESALKTLPALLQALHHQLPPSSHPLLPLLRLHALLLTPPTSLIHLNTAIITLATAYSGAETVYPSGHPTLAIILGEWGKLLAMEIPPDWGSQTSGDMGRRLESAVMLLRKATQACERGFGAGGGLVGREMEGLRRGCEGELGLLRAAR